MVSFGAGTVIINWLIDQAAKAGVHLVADFRATERNRMMEIAYRFAGFTDEPCACAADIGAPDAADGVRLLHLTPSRQQPQTVLRLVAPAVI